MFVRLDCESHCERKILGFCTVIVHCCCGLCAPNIFITKAKAKDNPGEFICLRVSTIGFGKRDLFEKGSFQQSEFCSDSENLDRDSIDSREPPDGGKQRRIRPLSRD